LWFLKVGKTTKMAEQTTEEKEEVSKKNSK